MLQVILMVIVAVVAGAVAVYAYLVESRRRTLLDRAAGADGGIAWREPSHGGAGAILLGGGRGAASTADRWRQLVPTSWLDDTEVQNKLIQAGFDSGTAPATYAVARLAALVVTPVLAYLAAPRSSFTMLIVWAAGGLLLGWIAPSGYVARKGRHRQERIRRSLPDTLDLMVVCVEAGVSLDAAILRVARELQLAHPEIAYEFAVVNRKVNAGVTREEALRGLWARTGVEDIRALVSSMIQSEKWGTSIAKVLRVASETLRRKRRQVAEKKAAMAPLKMTIPLVLLILPAMFIVILGPVALQMMATFR